MRMTDEVVRGAKILEEACIPPLDALHLSSALEARADYFCTCDDKLLRRAKALTDLTLHVVSPLELIEEIDR